MLRTYIRLTDSLPLELRQEILARSLQLISFNVQKKYSFEGVHYKHGNFKWLDYVDVFKFVSSNPQLEIDLEAALMEITLIFNGSIKVKFNMDLDRMDDPDNFCFLESFLFKKLRVSARSLIEEVNPHSNMLVDTIDKLVNLHPSEFEFKMSGSDLKYTLRWSQHITYYSHLVGIKWEEVLNTLDQHPKLYQIEAYESGSYLFFNSNALEKLAETKQIEKLTFRMHGSMRNDIKPEVFNLFLKHQPKFEIFLDTLYSPLTSEITQPFSSLNKIDTFFIIPTGVSDLLLLQEMKNIEMAMLSIDKVENTKLVNSSIRSLSITLPSIKNCDLSGLTNLRSLLLGSAKFNLDKQTFDTIPIHKLIHLELNTANTSTIYKLPKYLRIFGCDSSRLKCYDFSECNNLQLMLIRSVNLINENDPLWKLIPDTVIQLVLSIQEERYDRHDIIDDCSEVKLFGFTVPDEPEYWLSISFPGFGAVKAILINDAKPRWIQQLVDQTRFDDYKFVQIVLTNPQTKLHLFTNYDDEVLVFYPSTLKGNIDCVEQQSGELFTKSVGDGYVEYLTNSCKLMHFII